MTTGLFSPWTADGKLITVADGTWQQHKLLWHTKDLIKNSDKSWQQIADEAGVSIQTIKAWFDGYMVDGQRHYVFAARIPTLDKVLSVFGKTLDVVDIAAVGKRGH